MSFRSRFPTSGAGLPAVVGLLAAILACFWVWHVHLDPPPPAPNSINDISRYFHPSSVHMHDEYRSGSLPLWNPHQMAGMPFWATHIAGPGYPPNVVLLMLFEPARALEVHAVLHLLAAGVLTALFLGRLGVGVAGMAAGAVAYMLSGAMLALFYSVAYLSTCIWLPGVLWATQGLVTRARVADVVALSGMLALAFLGGHAQGFVFEAQLAAAWAATLLLTGEGAAARWRVLGLGVASVVAVIGLVAMQLLPTVEMLGQVPRAVEGLSLSEAGDFSARPFEVAGGLLGRGTRWQVSWLTLPLLALGFWDRPRRRAWLFFAVAAVVTALFALGPDTPVFRAYHALPAGDLFRFPYRIAFVYASCVSVLVGIGVQGAVDRVGRRASARSAALMAAALVGAVALPLVVPGRLQHALPIPPVETRGVSPELRAALVERWDRGRVFVENFGRHHASELPYLSGLMNAGFVVPTYEPMIPRAYTDYFGQDRLWRGFANVVPARSRFGWTRAAGVESFEPGGLGRLLDLMSVRWYVAHRAHAGRRLAELEAFTGSEAESVAEAWLLERETALPRTYLVHAQHVIEEPGEAHRFLQSVDFDPRRAVVVARAIAGVEPVPPDGVSGEGAEIVSYDAEEVVIDARCRSGCLLVLTDLDHPGWEAEADGEVLDIHRVNGLYRAVRLGPGSHRVVQRYRPSSFRVGAWVSAATLAVLGLAMLVAGRASRGAADSGP